MTVPVAAVLVAVAVASGSVVVRMYQDRGAGRSGSTVQARVSSGMPVKIRYQALWTERVVSTVSDRRYRVIKSTTPAST